MRKMKAELQESTVSHPKGSCKRTYRFGLLGSKVFTMKAAAIGIRVQPYRYVEEIETSCDGARRTEKWLHWRPPLC